MASSGNAKESSTTSAEVRSGLTITDQLHKMEQLLTERIKELDTRICSSETNVSQKIERNFEMLRSEIYSLQEILDAQKEKLDDAEDQIEDLQDEVARLKRELAKERERQNNLEQYQRRDCLRFLGVGPDQGKETVYDTEKKILSVINSDLKLSDIGPDDISIAHRVGPKTTKPRAIIVKFLRRKHKNIVISKRRLLKGTGKGIIEDLTPLNFSRLNFVKQHSNVKSAWTKEGAILALLQNGSIVRVEEGNYRVLGADRSDVVDVEMRPSEDQSRKADRQPSSSSRQDTGHSQPAQQAEDPTSLRAQPARSSSSVSRSDHRSSTRDRQHRPREPADLSSRSPNRRPTHQRQSTERMPRPRNR